MVLERDLHEVLSPLLSIERLLRLAIRVVQTGLRVLHNVRHLLEKNAIFALNLRVSLYTNKLRDISF